MSNPETYLKMMSTLSPSGELRLHLQKRDFPKPKSHEVVIKVEAAPINPSDHGVMFGWTDMSKANSAGEGAETVLTAPVSEHGMSMMRGRVDEPLSVGNEGAGLVVAAGDSPEAQALIGQRVAALGGGMFAEYAVAPVMMVLPLGEHSSKAGASSFVNPLTALGFVETMRMEGHTALVHTAAASNLGQMLNRICQSEGIEIVNIVRRNEQAQILSYIGAKHIINSSEDDFMRKLTDAVFETQATLGFDATGGGSLASDILNAMEQAAARTPGAYSIYGSTHHKQVYIYGGLDPSPTKLSRGYGMAWGVGGWLLPNFLAKAGMEVGVRLRQRVQKELTTTFKSHYTDEISLAQALRYDVVQRYNAKRTGEKFLICPHD